jgi:hypothetical protein
MDNTVADILKQLETLSVEESLEIYVPSINKQVKFKRLTLKQQKELLKTSIDENLIKLSFNILMNSIIAENIIDPIDTNSFYTIDRTAIAVAIRAKSLDNKYKSPSDKEIDLNGLVNLYPTITLDRSKLKTDIADTNFTVSLGAPTLNVDKELSTYALNRIKSSPNNDIKVIVGELVIYELVKFIKHIKIQDKEINFNSLTIKERITVAENLPSTVTNKIFDYVKQFRDIEISYAKIDDTVIDIDGNFFTV